MLALAEVLQLVATARVNLFSYALVTCEIQLFQNYFTGLLQLTNIFQRVQCRRNNFQITPSALETIFISVSDVVTCEIKHFDNSKIISK